MSFERIFLLVLGGMLLVFGIGYLVLPVPMLEMTGVSAGAPAAITDARATYGGFQIGLGVFLLWSAREPRRIPSALFCLGLVAGALGTCRLVGILVDGSLGPHLLVAPIHPSAMAFELASALVAFLLFARSGHEPARA